MQMHKDAVEQFNLAAVKLRILEPEIISDLPGSSWEPLGNPA